MAQETMHFDALVVGAGTAGSAAALFLARGGLKVALVEARPLDTAGARWINGVPPWMFDRAGLERPVEPERRGAAPPITILGGHGRRLRTIDPSPAWQVDVRFLSARLQSLARAAGVAVFDRIRTGALELDGSGRPVSLDLLRGSPGGGGRVPRMRIRSSLFVDAGGLGGALRRLVPRLARSCPDVTERHLCSAAQEVCEVGDAGGAASFLEKHDARPGEILCRLGLDGGFSTLNVQVGEGLDTVALLTGSIADGSHASGPRIMDELKRRHSWIGRRIFGGAGLVPLRRPYDLFTAPGIALVGDAACQVFAAHGSGTGMGLIAARLLADAAASHADVGSPVALGRYQTAFQRRFGPLLAFYDGFRRFSQPLHEKDVDTFLGSGLMTDAMLRAGLEQRLPRPSGRDLLGSLGGFLAAPGLVSKMAPRLALMTLACALYRRYPAAPDHDKLRSFSRAAAAIFNDREDIGDES